MYFSDKTILYTSDHFLLRSLNSHYNRMILNSISVLHRISCKPSTKCHQKLPLWWLQKLVVFHYESNLKPWFCNVNFVLNIVPTMERMWSLLVQRQLECVILVSRGCRCKVHVVFNLSLKGHHDCLKKWQYTTI